MALKLDYGILGRATWSKSGLETLERNNGDNRLCAAFICSAVGVWIREGDSGFVLSVLAGLIGPPLLTCGTAIRATRPPIITEEGDRVRHSPVGNPHPHERGDSADVCRTAS